MERLSEREEILISHASRDPFGYLSRRSAEVDFQDVFGGPPRRSGLFEPRRDRGDSLDLFAGRGRRGGFGDEVRGSRRACSGLGEQPVFGETSSPARRRQLGTDFFDDIFQGSDSLGTKERRAELHSFSSAPGSRIVSPNIRSLTPRCDPFTGVSSLPKQLSLGVKFGKGIDNQTLNSPAQGTQNKNDNGVPLLASRAVSTQEDHSVQTFPTYRQSPLSRRFAYSFESTSKVSGSVSFSRESQSRKDKTDSEGQSRSSRFHFSIYKWAGKGVSLMMPSNLKEKSNTGSNRRVLPEIVLQEVEMLSDDEMMPAISRTSDIKEEDQDVKLGNYLIAERAANPVIKEDLLPSKLEPNVIGSGVIEESDIKVEPQQTLLHDSYLTNSPSDTGKEITSTEHGANTSEVNILHDLPAGVGGKQGKTDIIRQAYEIDRVVRDQRDTYDHANANSQANEENNVNHNQTSPSMDYMQDIPIPMEDKMSGRRGKVKVKEFIKIFSQDDPPRPKETRPKQTSEIKNQKPVRKDVRKRKVEKEVSDRASKTVEAKASIRNDKGLTNNPITINQMLQQAEEPYPKIGSDIDMVSNSFLRKNETSAPDSVAEIFYDSGDIAEETHDLKGCLVEQLSEDQNEHLQSEGQQDQFQMSDAKIREWSKGKEGNIRSLLSTLQYILWPESGWRPVPLVDIIEGSSVKKAYQKALLCLHPDKLQQKGAAAHHKYIAEKVFDMLQDAWEQFNSVSVF
ncbi:hypothetical protein J5N97_010444 [Dioscorea zingiberensis]|uniref:J domain-containing protein required for chloroplast accumulation response 1 n=1 Tax=Dioscorea zingiberensis TaxID=325984 RepID=A0A9D5HMG8_9LILI|nr:hypothetical protein J5N97_010444 [Dioscorea zingiberensis]